MLGVLQGVPTGLVTVLAGVIRNLLNVLVALKDKKAESEPAAPEVAAAPAETEAAAPEAEAPPAETAVAETAAAEPEAEPEPEPAAPADKPETGE